MNASKSENSAVNQKSVLSPVDHHRWGDASEEEIRKLSEKKTKKKMLY
jgi:hypothetical protein